jgi:hypothetical protein
MAVSVRRSAGLVVMVSGRSAGRQFNASAGRQRLRLVSPVPAHRPRTRPPRQDAQPRRIPHAPKYPSTVILHFSKKLGRYGQNFRPLGHIALSLSAYIGLSAQTLRLARPPTLILRVLANFAVISALRCAITPALISLPHRV